MKKEEVKPGCYRLTCDLPAISPDRRGKYDWRKLPMTAGTIFAVSETVYAKILEIAPLGDIGRINVLDSGLCTLLENMIPVDEDPWMFLQREWGRGANMEAVGVLIKLFERGTITMNDVIAVSEEEKAQARADNEPNEGVWHETGPVVSV